MHVSKGSHTWVIEDFLGKLKEAKLRKQADDCLESDTFDIPVMNCYGDQRRLRFQLEFDWNTVDVWNTEEKFKKDYFTIYLTCLTLESDVTVKYMVEAMFGPSKGHILSKEEKVTFSKPDRKQRRCQMNYTKKRMRDIARMYAEVDRTLTLVTKISVIYELNQVGAAMGNRLDRMLWDSRDKTGDIILTCGEERVPVHKAVLAAKSDAFAAMLEHEDTLESQTGRIQIEDMDPGCLIEFVRCIYLDNYSSMDLPTEVIESLLVAADKYLIDELKNKCDYTLSKIVRDTNVGHMGALATMFNCLYLRKSVVQFVTDSYSELAGDPDGQWRLLPVDIISEAESKRERPI